MVDYFRELGGEAHYSDLYRHIEAHPRRKLGKSWQAVVRRTIEEHSSDSTIWHKRRLPDLFRSVNGLGEGRWALRNLADGCNHLILRSNVGSPWNDSDGERYEFGRTVPNWTKVRAGDDVLVERIQDGRHFLIGTGRIGSVEDTEDGKIVATYAEYENFAQPIPIPPTFTSLISALPGNNPQHSITLIPENVFAHLLLEMRSAEQTKVLGDEIRGPEFERGGLEPPKRRPIADKPPRPSTKELARSDPEARRQALERRKIGHHKLLLAFREVCRRNDVFVDCTQYADALAVGWIFEMKTIEEDAAAQVRSALGQLYHYMFLHRDMPGYNGAGLSIVLDKAIDPELVFFLVSKANISIAWRSTEGFMGAGAVLQALPWLFKPLD